MENEQIVEQNTDEQEVDVTQLPDDELTQALEGEPVEVEEDVSDDTSEEQEQPESVSEETESVEESTEVAEQQVKEKKSFQFNKQKYIDEGITDEKALSAIEKAEKSAYEKQKIIGKQGNELGDARKQLENVNQLKEQLEQLRAQDDAVKEQAYDNPEAGFEHFYKKQQIQQQIEKNEADAQYYQTQEYVQSNYPDFEDYMDEMVEVVKEYGGGAKELIELREFPFRADTQTLTTLYREARALKRDKEKDAKINELTSAVNKLLGKPNEVIKNITRTASSQPMPSSIGSQVDANKIPSDIHALSDEQLEALLAKQMK